MKRSFLIVVVVFFSLIAGCLKEDVDEYAMISFLLGEVTCNDTAVEIGDIIKEKDIIKTGKDSFCDIRIGGSIIRIKSKSSVTMSHLIRKGNVEDTTIGLTVGKMLCKPKKLLKSEKFIVKTPTAVAGVRGTRFIVEADSKKTTRIKVFNGKVKVARRIKQFEGSIEQVLQVAPVLQEDRKVVITREEVVKAEKTVEKVMKAEKLKKSDFEMASVIDKTRKEVVIPQKAIEKFRAEDFQKDKKEIISIKPKPPVVIRKIVKVIREEKKMPKPDGRLLVTRYEIYFIKGGKVLWEGPVVNQPVKKDTKIYIASGDYVFCADKEGPVLWRKNIANKGKLELQEGKLVVHTAKGTTSLDPDTGQQQ